MELIIQEKRNFFLWRATAAIKITDDFKMYVKVVLCSPRDRFDQKQGANKAKGLLARAIERKEPPLIEFRMEPSIRKVRSIARQQIRQKKIAALDNAKDYFVNRRTW